MAFKHLCAQGHGGLGCGVALDLVRGETGDAHGCSDARDGDQGRTKAAVALLGGVGDVGGIARREDVRRLVQELVHARVHDGGGLGGGSVKHIVGGQGGGGQDGEGGNRGVELHLDYVEGRCEHALATVRQSGGEQSVDVWPVF